MSYDPLGEYHPGMWQMIQAGALMVVTAALGVAEWFLMRLFVLRFLALGRVSVWAWRWWDLSSFILLGVLWLALVYYSAHQYWEALATGRLWRVFAVISLVQILVPTLIVCGLELLG